MKTNSSRANLSASKPPSPAKNEIHNSSDVVSTVVDAVAKGVGDSIATVENTVDAFVSTLTKPFGRNATHKRYAGRDLSIGDKTRTKVKAGDLRGFWKDRLGDDPVARVGLALWGNDNDLNASIDREGLEYWKPDLNIISALGLAMRKDLPADFPFPPETKEEIFTYWKWTGKVTNERVIDKAIDAGVLPELPSTEEVTKFTRSVGEAVALAHVDAIDNDFKTGQGKVPGLLNISQIAAYHHEVFQSFGLPKNTYGGTPYRNVPNVLEFLIAGGLYGHDADPK